MTDNYCKCCGDGTPEYIIELNQQGAPGKRGEKGDEGYSPVIDFIADNDEIRFSSTNENNITSTPNLYDFVAKKDLSNVNNLYDLVAKRDLSNLPNPVTINDITINNYNSGQVRLYSDKAIMFQNQVIGLGISGTYLTVNRDLNNIYLNTTNGGKATYNGNELATVNNISDSKITISQGNVVKGSFTLNQSGDTTIELDSGITNPLKIEGGTENNPSGGTITYSMELGLDSSNKVYLDHITSYYTSTGGLNYSVSENIIKDNKVVGLTAVENSIAELTTLADNTEASLNELKTDYESNKTKVAEELTTLGNQINTKASKAELDELADTKNDNIFDIGKFTVIGSPTITDDGVASGFNGSNRIRIPFPSSVTNFTAELNFKFNDTSIASYSNYCIHAGSSPFMIYINASNGKYGNISAIFTNSDISTQYNLGTISGSSHFLTERVYFEYRLLNNILSCRVRFGETGDWINFPTTYTITDVILTKAYSLLASYSSAFNCDLKHFSITVDGEKIFNGLMSSTVPIYDKIATTNTTLSTFKTDTTNNFSAVNSALNEKANLSDLANYVPLATYNELLARVEALEAEINGGNA